MALIKLDNVSKFYKSGDGVSVGMRRVSLEFNLGEFIAVTGESGSGKSTLLNVVSGLDSYEDGELYIKNEETSHFTNKDWENYRSKYIGFIFQSYNIIDSYTVYENVMLALEIQNYPRGLRKKRALELIEKVGLLSHKNHKAAKLSGGQKQRTVIARALAKDCPIIVADEPTGNLDSESGKQVIDLLQEISKEKLIVIVTHDYDQVKDYATRRIKMHDGEVVEDKKIKKAEIMTEHQEPDLKPMTLVTVMKFAIRNILSMPRRFSFFILLQMMIVLVFTFVYSNSMVAARNASFGGGIGTMPGENYFDFHLSKISDNRMIVLRKDATPMTDADYMVLDSLAGVDSYVYRDITYIDRFQLEGFSFMNNEGFIDFQSNFTLNSTVAIDANPQFLVEGSMSNLADNEIIISNGFSNLDVGDVITFDYYSTSYLVYEATFNDVENIFEWPFDPEYPETHLWIHTAFGYTIYYQYYWNDYFDPAMEGLSPDEIDGITVRLAKSTNHVDSFIIKGIYNDNFNRSLYFSHDFLDINVNGSAFMLTAPSSISAERLFETIDKNVYRVIYPYLNTDSIQSLFAPINFLIALFYYALVLLMGLFLYFVLFTVMRNVMNARKKDFAIFRSIGANQSKLGWLVILEQFFMMIISFVASMLILRVIRFYDFNVDRTMQQMILMDYVVLFLTFAYLSFWLARRFNNKTFKFSVIENITESKEEGL